MLMGIRCNDVFVERLPMCIFGSCLSPLRSGGIVRLLVGLSVLALIADSISQSTPLCIVKKIHRDDPIGPAVVVVRQAYDHDSHHPLSGLLASVYRGEYQYNRPRRKHDGLQYDWIIAQRQTPRVCVSPFVSASKAIERRVCTRQP